MDRGHNIPVLDTGSVQLIDYMGSDQRVADTARVSYSGDNFKRSSDEGLIRYLMRHKHTSPFESCVVTLRLKMPMFIARQWVRHRTASMNEVSARYSELPADVYIPEAERVCYQSTDNKQGSGAVMPEAQAVTFIECIKGISRKCFDQYKFALECGVSKELARIALPLNTYTEFYWTQNLHKLFHLVKLRSDPHAQWEIRQYADAVIMILKELFPISYKAFEDYVKDAVTFSKQEIAALQSLIEDNDVTEAEAECAMLGRKASDSELNEFVKKLNLVRKG